MSHNLQKVVNTTSDIENSPFTNKETAARRYVVYMKHITWEHKELSWFKKIANIS